MTRLTTLLPTIGIVCAAVTIGGCGGSGPGDFTLVQAAPQIAAVDLGPSGTSKGDQRHFEATVTRDGKPAGTLLGTLTVRDFGGESGGSSARIDESELVFRLEDGDLFAQGVAEYPGTDFKIEAEEPVRRAILGGTGAYAGASGELVTTRREDGTYEQRFIFGD